MCYVQQSIVQKKTNIRRQRREMLQKEMKEQRQEAQAAANPAKSQKEQAPRVSEPLKPVENQAANISAAHNNTAVTSQPMKSPPAKQDSTKTVAFGRTTSKVTTPPRSASRNLHVRRYSLENDNVSVCTYILPKQVEFEFDCHFTLSFV